MPAITMTIFKPARFTAFFDIITPAKDKELHITIFFFSKVRYRSFGRG